MNNKLTVFIQNSKGIIIPKDASNIKVSNNINGFKNASFSFPLSELPAGQKESILNSDVIVYYGKNKIFEGRILSRRFSSNVDVECVGYIQALSEVYFHYPSTTNFSGLPETFITNIINGTYTGWSNLLSTSTTGLVTTGITNFTVDKNTKGTTLDVIASACAVGTSSNETVFFSIFNDRKLTTKKVSVNPTARYRLSKRDCIVNISQGLYNTYSIAIIYYLNNSGNLVTQLVSPTGTIQTSLQQNANGFTYLYRKYLSFDLTELGNLTSIPSGNLTKVQNELDKLTKVQNELGSIKTIGNNVIYDTLKRRFVGNHEIRSGDFIDIYDLNSSKILGNVSNNYAKTGLFLISEVNLDELGRLEIKPENLNDISNLI